MRFRFTLLTAALLVSPLTQAKPPLPLSDAAALADSVTLASDSADYQALQQRVQRALVEAIRGKHDRIARSQLNEAKQGKPLADSAWLKASGYDFAKKANQQAGIALLGAFSTQPESTLKQNLETVENINLNATATLRRQALIDAEGQNYLYFLADALGPRLGQAFIRAYNKGELGKAAALIKASEVSTGEAKKHFDNPRPFLVPANTIHRVADNVVVNDNQPYTADGGSFPSGHTSTGYTDALLMAQMVPERFVPLIDRGARYGYSRLVLGVHYPLDVMGSRMVAQRNVAHYLNDPAYRRLFDDAKQQLRSALEKECGMSLKACAQVPAKDDPYAAKPMQAFYRFTMTYNLPAQQGEATPVVVPQGAEVLLEAALPGMSAAGRRQRMINTALAGGYPLSGNADQSFWQRVNLHDAVRSAGH